MVYVKLSKKQLESNIINLIKITYPNRSIFKFYYNKTLKTLILKVKHIKLVYVIKVTYKLPLKPKQLTKITCNRFLDFLVSGSDDIDSKKALEISIKFGDYTHIYSVK